MFRSFTMVLRLMLLVILALAPARAASEQNGTPEPNKPVLALEGPAAIITLLIKPDKTADFEFVLGKVKEALQKSDKPERKQQAAGWQVYKSPQPVQGNAVYIMRIEPVVIGQEYDISRLIAEAFPVEVHDIFPKYRDAFAGRAITDLTPVISMQP